MPDGVVIDIAFLYAPLDRCLLVSSVWKHKTERFLESYI